MEDPFFHHPFNVTKEEHRELTLKQLQELADRKIIGKAYPEEFGGQANPGANIAGFAEMFHAHPSMQIKGGVQWGLFGSAILSLGNEDQHKKWLPGVLNLELPGVYAMTEIGHGSDVGNIGTTATYIADDDEFEIHTPFKAAWKDYLGNAAMHGKAAVVFAQLITQNVNYGVQANENGMLVLVRTLAAMSTTSYGNTDDTAPQRFDAMAIRNLGRLNEGHNNEPGSLEVIAVELGLAQATMGNIGERHKAQKAQLDNMLGDLEGVNSEEVAMEILALKTRLEASYQTTSMIAQMSLVNYL